MHSCMIWGGCSCCPSKAWTWLTVKQTGALLLRWSRYGLLLQMEWWQVRLLRWDPETHQDDGENKGTDSQQHKGNDITQDPPVKVQRICRRGRGRGHKRGIKASEQRSPAQAGPKPAGQSFSRERKMSKASGQAQGVSATAPAALAHSDAKVPAKLAIAVQPSDSLTEFAQSANGASNADKQMNLVERPKDPHQACITAPNAGKQDRRSKTLSQSPAQPSSGILELPAETAGSADAIGDNVSIAQHLDEAEALLQEVQAVHDKYQHALTEAVSQIGDQALASATFIWWLAQ